GVEALVRWQHPDWGLLAPVAFVDAAERSGAILDIGQHVLEVSCRQWAVWHAEGHDLRLSVNLPPRQLGDPRLVERLAGVMATHGIPPERLWLEVTESALVDDLDHASEVLGGIVDLGVGISIDDFGTGWA